MKNCSEERSDLIEAEGEGNRMLSVGRRHQENSEKANEGCMMKSGQHMVAQDLSTT